jgi:hypothetical protein
MIQGIQDAVDMMKKTAGGKAGGIEIIPS